MTTVEVLKIEEAGSDYVRLCGGNRDVRINFADDETFSKEDSAGFFRGLKGKPAAIPVDESIFGATSLMAASKSYHSTLGLRLSSGLSAPF